MYADPGGGVVAEPPDLSDDGEVTMSSRTICTTHGIDGPQWVPVAYDDEDDELDRLIEDDDLLEDDEFFDDEDDDLEEADDLDDEDAEDF